MTNHNLPKIFRCTFSIHSQPQSHEGCGCYCLSHSPDQETEFPEHWKCLWHQPGACRDGMVGRWWIQRAIWGMMHPAMARETWFITSSENYSGNHRGSNWSLLDRETSPFCFQVHRPVSLCWIPLLLNMHLTNKATSINPGPKVFSCYPILPPKKECFFTWKKHLWQPWTA